MTTLIVNLTKSDGAAKAMRHAVAIAQAGGAHLVGLYVEHARLAMTGLYGFGSAYVYPGTSLLETRLRDEVRAAFETACESAGIAHEFRFVETRGVSPFDAIANQSRLADLFVVGAETERGDDPTAQGDFLSVLVSAAGRPVLVVPEDAPDEPALELAKIAWDGSREAARAVFDAVPLLQMHEGVRIITANVSPGEGDRVRASQKRLKTALARHGITATTRLVAGKGNDARALLEQGREADLMVLGAFHHNRLREQIFGGVTFDLCKAPPCPLLLAR